MNIPYRTRLILKRVLIMILIVLLLAAVCGVLWFLWLSRFVVYTRESGAVLDMTLPQNPPAGQMAVPPETMATIPIYYNEGENAINTSRELTQIVGYYADTAALEKGTATVLSQIQALPAGTPVMLDVKSPKGSFFYSSTVSTKRYSDIDPAAMDEIFAYLEQNDYYAIARLPALRDYEFGLNHVSDGLPTSGGYLWADDDYCYWLNPASQGTVTYLISIVTELKNRGFDEVVFDEFRFPDTEKIVFSGDKQEALATSAKTLLSACATDSFCVSFVGDASFPLPEGRSRLYMTGVAAAQADSVAEQTGLEDPAVHLVFLTEVHDTRFDVYSVLRPLAAAH